MISARLQKTHNTKVEERLLKSHAASEKDPLVPQLTLDISKATVSFVTSVSHVAPATYPQLLS